MIYRTFLWARNKIKMDDNLTYFLNSELRVEENRPTMMNQEKIKQLKTELKSRTSEELSTSFLAIFKDIDLSIAPKFYVICHISISILPPNKRMALSRKLNFKNLSYIPKIKNGLSENYFCEFLSYWAFYLDSKFGCSVDMMSIFEEVVDVEKYVDSNILKGQDLTFLDRSLDMLRQLMMILESFFHLGDYFFLDARPNRIEGNIVGLVLNDISSLYNFCNHTISIFEDKLFEIEDKEFACALFEIYSKFIKFNIRFKSITKKIKDFVELFLISLPEFYYVDKEKNSKIEKYFLKEKPKTKLDNCDIIHFLKNLNLPKNGDLAHIDKNNELLHQTFFTETQNSDDEIKEKIELEVLEKNKKNKFGDLEIKIQEKDLESLTHDEAKYELSAVDDDADEENFEI